MRKYVNYEYQHDLIKRSPASGLNIVVVIPAYDEPQLKRTIDSLWHTDRIKGVGIEVMVVVNDSESSSAEIVKQNDHSYRELKEISEKTSKDSPFQLHPLRIKNIPARQAGVGLARKIGMDEAVKRLLKVKANEGIICSLDADVKVDHNYFRAIWEAYSRDPKLRAASVYFEHDLQESGISEEAKKAIVDYESHLRYHIRMQRLIALPYAYHTVGSTMTVRASAYLAHFGMNKRQAGEDFYFLHKFIKSAYYREITDTTVYPSARISDRVPFGTGKMVEKLSDASLVLKTYHFQNYLDLQPDLEVIWKYFEQGEMVLKDLSPPFRAFTGDKLLPKLAELKKHSSHPDAFKKRFFQWFDAFMLIKYLHFMRDHYRENIPVEQAVGHLFELMKCTDDGDPVSRLMLMRKLDKKQK